MQERFNARTGHRYVSAFLGAHFDMGRPVRQKCLMVQNSYTREELLAWVEDQQLDCLISQDSNCYLTLKEARFNIPEKTGYAALSWQDGWHDELQHISGMYHDPYELGQVAVDLLTAHMQRNEQGLPQIPKTLTIDPVWREAETLRSAAE